MKDGLLKADRLNVEIYSNSAAAGKAAALHAAEVLRRLSGERQSIGVVFATGASQLATLEALVAMDDLPWNKIVGMHLDEYVGISADDRGSFRHYLRNHLTNKVHLKAFYEIDGSSSDPEKVCEKYADLLHSVDPQLCLLGIGENGHLAFNDPGVADFEDPHDVKVVDLDRACREQQAAEGWFDGLDQVPKRALTLTLPALLRISCLIASVPGHRKASIVRRALEEPISIQCPATILRQHKDATLYLDKESAAELDQGDFMQGKYMEISESKRR